MRSLVHAFVLVTLLSACKKEEPKQDKPAATAPADKAEVAPAPADGIRRVEIEAGKDGYVPDRIPGKPGEKLKLVFTRTIEGECLAELKTPDGKKVELPMRRPIEIDVTVPTDGEVKFACGMDMFTGVIVADKKS